MYSRVLLYALVASVPVLLSGCADSGPMESASESAAESGSSAMAMAAGNAITGEGLPNPAPVVTSNWGDLPEGREWGSTAGIDIRSYGWSNLGLRALRCRQLWRRRADHLR